MRGLVDFELDADPGEQWTFSKPGYNVLGALVAEISGVRYEEYVNDHILAPLGMDADTFQYSEIDFDMLARGHYLDGTGHLAMTEEFPCACAYTASSGLVTNLDDLTRGL